MTKTRRERGDSQKVLQRIDVTISYYYGGMYGVGRGVYTEQEAGCDGMVGKKVLGGR